MQHRARDHRHRGSAREESAKTYGKFLEEDGKAHAKEVEELGKQDRW